MIKKWGKITIVFLGIIMGVSPLFSQEGKTHKPRYVSKNLLNFDDRQYHFGFIIALNQSDFVITKKFEPTLTDSLFLLENIRTPGFNLGIVSTYRLTPNVRFRFLPTLSFQDRKLVYHYAKSDSTVKTFEKIIESTFIELPIYIKLRTNRIGNVAAYAIGGAKFMIDMSSKKDNESQNDKDLMVKTRKYQSAAEFGGGLDFFLPYFKFGIEVKMGIGLHDVLIPEAHRFSSPIEKLVPKSYSVTFTFEG